MVVYHHGRRHQAMKRIKLLAAAAALAFAAAGFSCSRNGSSKSGDVSGESLPDEVYPDLTVTFLDVGKADSIVITSGDSTVVIDCGEKGDGKDIMKFLKDQGIETIDCLIATHYDKDHIGGAAKIVSNFNVLSVLGPDYQELSSENDKFRNAMRNKEIVPQMVTEDLTFELGGAEYTVYAPEKNDYGPNDDNDFSLVTKLVYHDNTFIFAGDAMEQRLDEVMDIGDCDLLKIPYHGRKIANLEEFVEATAPEYAVICTSQDELSSKTQDILDDHSVRFWATCNNGRVTAVSNGREITVAAEK